MSKSCVPNHPLNLFQPKIIARCSRCCWIPWPIAKIWRASTVSSSWYSSTSSLSGTWRHCCLHRRISLTVRIRTHFLRVASMVRQSAPFQSNKLLTHQVFHPIEPLAFAVRDRRLACQRGDVFCGWRGPPQSIGGGVATGGRLPTFCGCARANSSAANRTAFCESRAFLSACCNTRRRRRISVFKSRT